MKYYTTKEASELLGVTKRYLSKLCSANAIEGAEKRGSRWVIPESFVAEKTNRKAPAHVFNTTGICNPDEHYMVDLTQRLADVRTLIDEGKYFTINRARQFGKTTTLYALADFLSPEYLVLSMDFQMQMSDAKFRNENVFALAFARAFVSSSRTSLISTEPDYDNALKAFAAASQMDPQHFELVELCQEISSFCAALPRKVVLMIDEIDSATNNQVFIDFLAKLRGDQVQYGGVEVHAAAVVDIVRRGCVGHVV